MSDTNKVPNYPANSKKQKEAAKTDSTEERQKPQAVVSSDAVKTRKRPLSKKIAETFTGDDAKSVGNYVLFDVVLPAAKSMISEAVSQGVERMLFGDVRGRTRPGQGLGAGRTNYSYNKPGTVRNAPGENRRDFSNRGRSTHDFDEIILDTRGDAETVLFGLRNILEDYPQVSVADLYSLLDITGSFTDNKWGWYDLRDANIIRARNGYLIDLPRPVELN